MKNRSWQIWKISDTTFDRLDRIIGETLTSNVYLGYDEYIDRIEAMMSDIAANSRHA